MESQLLSKKQCFFGMKILNLVKIALLISCVYLFNSCSEEEPSPPSEPTIETGVVAVKEIGGATFSGLLTSQEIITDHGFIYGQDSLLKSPLSNRLSLGKPTESGTFIYDLTVGLKGAEIYYFRAYIAVNGACLFGDIKSFFSNGSVPPVIDRVNPEKGHLGEKVVIYGKNFGTNSFYTRVKFGNTFPETYYVVDTAISVKVPTTLPSDKMQLTVTVFDKSTGTSFELYTPEIHKITPEKATFRDIITVQGAHFDTIPSQNEVWLGDIKAIPISSTRDEIKFIVPDDLQVGKTVVKINSQVQEVISEQFFSLLQPEIFEFPACANSDTHLEIKGDNFHPNFNQNRVFFGDTEATIIGGDKKNLQVTVPYGPFPKSRSKIKVQVSDVIVEADRDICITDKWVMISNSLPFDFFGDIPDKGYVLSISYSSRERNLWEFDPDSESWTKRNLPFSSEYLGSSSNNEKKGYVYLATGKNNFWEFDPVSKQWREVKDFPGNIRYGSAMFCIGNHVYLGAGKFSTYGGTTYYKDFYRYDIETNIWVRLKDIATPTLSVMRPSFFVINNQAYLAGGYLSNSQHDFWKYNPEEDKWDQMADLPDAYDRDLHFSLNGKGYLTNTDTNVWEYDPLSDSWENFYRFSHFNKREGFAFVTDGTAYIGGGDSHSIIKQHPWKEFFRLGK
jgi:hypothetical protein